MRSETQRSGLEGLYCVLLVYMQMIGDRYGKENFTVTNQVRGVEKQWSSISVVHRTFTSKLIPSWYFGTSM